MRALERSDMDAMLALLTEDATWSMPPLANWYRGHEAIAGFLEQGPFTVDWRHAGHARTASSRWLATRAATALYRAYALDVLELRGDRIAAIVAFLDGSRFEAFGLPQTLDAMSPAGLSGRY